MLSAAAVPLAGIDADLTGSAAVDAVLLGALALLVIGGLAVLEPTDGAAPAVTSAAAVGLLVIAVGVDDPAAPVAAAVAGAALGLLVHTAAPAALRLGRSGPGTLGTALVAAAFGIEPAVAAPAATLVPALVLLVPVLAATLPSLALRLRARSLPPATTLAVVSGIGAGAAVALDRGEIEALAAVAIAGGALLLVLLVALTVGRPRRGTGDGAHPVVAARRARFPGARCRPARRLARVRCPR